MIVTNTWSLVIIIFTSTIRQISSPLPRYRFKLSSRILWHSEQLLIELAFNIMHFFVQLLLLPYQIFLSLLLFEASMLHHSNVFIYFFNCLNDIKLLMKKKCVRLFFGLRELVYSCGQIQVWVREFDHLLSFVWLRLDTYCLLLYRCVIAWVSLF